MKICTKCLLDKPESEFSNDPRYRCGLKSACKKCTYEQAKLSPSRAPEHRKKMWHQRLSDPIKRAAYNLSHVNRYRSKNPGALPIEVVISHRKQSKESKIEGYAARLAERYGGEFAQAFLENPFVTLSKKSLSGRRLQNLKALFIKSKTNIETVSQSTIRRVEDINRACNFPLMNVGWHCLSCGLIHSNPWFFDLDHIIPRSMGGTSGPENMQCLCPNCHRKKTLGMDDVAQNQSFKQQTVQLGFLSDSSR